ncbi:CpsD/CapB family tyrosine-protein kinase [Anaerococcus marasmi]|uniref:CpsD/CapB family tyrosine-protein kinase n=1 Tax=Anaerococcus marasmi TaxID=2057797 RepID=UPI000CF8D87B|nr:CpsD/CapB family tyrosine-protein kinase [Anaerococcus marasmi]
MFRKKDEEKKEIALQAFYDLEDKLVKTLGSSDKLIGFTSTTNHTDQVLNVYIMAKHLAEEGDRILIIDANLREPALEDLTDKFEERGFIDGVLGDYSKDDLIKFDEKFDNIYLMYSGKVSDYADEFLEPTDIKNFIESLRDSFDYIFVNTTANKDIPEANMFLALCDKVLVFTTFANKDNDLYKESIKQLENVNAEILGIVLTNYIYSETEVREMFGED